jgi:hypothetical protein
MRRFSFYEFVLLASVVSHPFARKEAKGWAREGPLQAGGRLFARLRGGSAAQWAI